MESDRGSFSDAALAADVPAEWRPKGSARAEARFSGALDNPTVAAELSSDDLGVAGQAFRRLRATLRMANRVVSVDTLNLTQDEGQLTATGRYALSSGRYTFEMAGDALTIVPLVPERATRP